MDPNSVDQQRKMQLLARVVSVRDELEKAGLGCLLLRLDNECFRILVRTQRLEAVEEQVPRLRLKWSDCIGIDLEPLPGGGVILTLGFEP